MALLLPTEILDLIVEQSDKITLSNLSLINKQFSWSARRKLWYQIAILGEETGGFIDCVAFEQELGHLVKDLSLVSRVHLGKQGDFNLVKARKLVRLLELLPNLLVLDIDSIILQPLKNLNGMDFQLNFDLINLTTFRYILMDKFTGLHFLRKIIGRAINLKHLNIQIKHISRTFQPIHSCCESLSSLKITNDTSISLLDPTRPLIPLTSLRKLKEFTYHGINDAATSIGILQLLQQNASTLEVLDLYSALDTSFQCSDFSPLFSSFKSMKSLTIESLTELPVNFFQILPPSLTTLDSPFSIHPSQLLHLRQFPQPHLKL